MCGRWQAAWPSGPTIQLGRIRLLVLCQLTPLWQQRLAAGVAGAAVGRGSGRPRALAAFAACGASGCCLPLLVPMQQGANHLEHHALPRGWRQRVCWAPHILLAKDRLQANGGSQSGSSQAKPQTLDMRLQAIK